MKKIIVLIMLLTTFKFSNGTEWFPSKHICPICKTNGTYQDIVSYGSYIYQWPSKFQYIFWPLTDNPSIYCCLKCHYSTYMWDFDSIPTEKKETIKRFLETIKLDTDYKDYLDIPMTTRFEFAEKIYQILTKSTDFWCKFYRVMGYHYEEERFSEKASIARRKALILAQEQLKAPEAADQEKEILLIIASMYHFTGQRDSALVCLNKASLLTYKNKNIKPENEKNLDKYLTTLIQQFVDLIKQDREKTPNTAANNRFANRLARRYKNQLYIFNQQQLSCDRYKIKIS